MVPMASLRYPCLPTRLTGTLMLNYRSLGEAKNSNISFKPLMKGVLETPHAGSRRIPQRFGALTMVARPLCSAMLENQVSQKTRFPGYHARKTLRSALTRTYGTPAIGNQDIIEQAPSPKGQEQRKAWNDEQSSGLRKSH